MVHRSTIALFAGLFAIPALAKTDYSGCVSSETVAYGGASLIWYVPDTGEICQYLDCGGGRAPPKTTVPGCDGYSGTGTYSPSYLDLVTSTAASAVDSATTTLATRSSGMTDLPTVTSDTTVLTGTLSPTITSAATLTTSVTGTSMQGSASTSTTSAGSSNSSSASTAAGVMATAAPFGMLIGLAAGAAAIL